MIRGIKWYLLRLYFSSDARGPEEFLETHMMKLAKKFNLIAVTVLKEASHYYSLGSPASTQLFGGRPGSKPVITELFISENKFDPFLKELNELLQDGKSNMLYSKHELHALLGDPSTLDRIDEYKE